MAAEFISAERRPIAARDWHFSKRLADGLVKLGVSPNAISVAGMGCGVAAGLLLAWTTTLTGLEQRLAWAAAAMCVLLRLLANMLDGMVALAAKRTSPTGEIFNEVPDRVSDAATLLGLGLAAGGVPLLGALAACLALFTAYLRAMGKYLTGVQDFRGPLAKPQRMAAVIVIALALAVLPVEWQPAWSGLQLPALGLVVVAVGTAITCWRRLTHITAILKQRAA